jgi:drug/metabolite transporter (DMT)-like permease
MTTQIFLLAAFAGFCYALQGTLLSKYARKFDGFTSSLFRNASFILTMSPLLYFAGWEGIQSVGENYTWLFLLFSGFFGMIALSFSFSAHKYLPVAVANAIGQLSPLLIFFWTFFLLGEIPKISEIISVFIVLGGLVILNLSQYEFEHLEDDNPKGFLFAFLGIFFGSISVSLMVNAARTSSDLSHTYAVSYFWETSIALFFLITFLAKKHFKLTEKKSTPEVLKIFLGKKDALFPNAKQMLQIALAASPTIIGSTLLPIAMNLGTPGVVSTITSAIAAITGITLAWILYKEKLSIHHFLGIFCVLIGIGMMQVLG